jgi:hypothetical protein
MSISFTILTASGIIGAILAGGPDVPIAVDLTSIRGELSKDPAYKELNKRIGRYAAVNSVARDLEDAAHSIAVLSEVDKAGGEDRFSLGRPLMTHAVMMYCRGTIEDGSGRFKVGSTRSYSETQLQTHREIVKLRNKSIAHFGVGEGRYGAGWIDERVILQTTDDNQSFFVKTVWSRRNYLAQLALDLMELIPIAQLSVSELIVKAGQELMSLLVSLTDDSKLAHILIAAKFDPAEFFGNPDSAEAFWKRAEFAHEIAEQKYLEDGSLMSAGISTVTVLPPR